MTDSVFRQHCRRESAAIAKLESSGYRLIGVWSERRRTVYVDRDGVRTEHRNYHEAAEALLTDDGSWDWEQLTLDDVAK